MRRVSIGSVRCVCWAVPTLSASVVEKDLAFQRRGVGCNLFFLQQVELRLQRRTASRLKQRDRRLKRWTVDCEKIGSVIYTVVKVIAPS